MTIIHQTPGLLDIRSITVPGMSAKPNSKNPIGMFGTGLKYAIAVLVRNGANPVLWIGKDRYEFSSAAVDFRGTEHHQLMMRLQRFSFTKARNIALPYTTEYGRNWKMWMAFREIEANTRDEGGFTTSEDVEPTADTTLIVIDHPDYEKAWEARDDIFLPDALSVREGSEGLQVLPGASNRIYYRGLRAMDLPKPTLYTYSVLAPIELTEDRTFKYDFQVREQFGLHIASSEDEALIQAVVTADKEHWEHELEFPRYVVPSEAFRRVMARNPKGRSSSSIGYYASHDRSPSITKATAWDTHPRPWKIAGSAVVDAKGTVVFDCPYKYAGRWELIAQAILDRLGANPPEALEPEEEEEAAGPDPSHLVDSLAYGLAGPHPTPAPDPDDQIPF